MFARKISIRLKPNTLAEFNQKFEHDVIPLLRKQPGFKDEITFAAPGSPDLLAISLWDSKQNAEAWDTTAYKDVLKMLANVIEGTPKVSTTAVLYSTLYQVPADVPQVAAIAAAKPVAGAA